MNATPRAPGRLGLLTAALLTSVFAISTLGLVSFVDHASAKDGNSNSNSGPSANSGPGNATSNAKADPEAATKTASPIKHVIILIGENRGLDHTFGVYKPKAKGATISNMLSLGIVKADGTPGKNFALAQQFAVAPQPAWYIGAPDAAKTLYSATNLMPQPNTNGTPTAQSTTGAPFTSVAVAKSTGETDVNADDFDILTTGASGLPTGVLDTRIPGAGNLPNGPFQLQGPKITDDDYTGDMTHRFYQAAQQQDCAPANATKANPTGCLNDLFPFVMATYSATNKSAGNEMGFYNAEQEQATMLKSLADRFTLIDNFHQSFLGGTAANHPRHAGHRRCGLLQRRPGQCGDAACRGHRQSEPEGRNRQPVHGRRQLRRMLGRHPTGRRPDREISLEAALRGRTELR